MISKITYSAIAILVLYIMVVESRTTGLKPLIANQNLTVAGTFKTKTYYREARPMKLAEANATCLAEGLTLVTVDTVKELEYLKENINYQAQHAYWTGAIDEAEFSFNGINRKNITINRNGEYNNNCVYLYFTGLWRTPCSMGNFPLCQDVSE